MKWFVAIHNVLWEKIQCFPHMIYLFAIWFSFSVNKKNYKDKLFTSSILKKNQQRKFWKKS
jgi:hypothetical protein